MEILVISFTILYAILAWKRLDLATALLIVALPVYQIRFNILGLPSTLLEVMILVLFLAWFIKSWRNKELPLFNSKLKNIKSYPFSREIILLLVIAFIATAVTGFSNPAFGILKAYFIEPIMFFIVFVNVFKFKENRNKIFWALSISALVVSLVAIYQRITGNLMPAEWVDSGRITGVFNYPNAVGLYLGPIALILIGKLLISLRNIKYLILNIFLSVTIILSLISIYLAKSEGALIGIAAALFIFGLLYTKWSRRIVIGAVVISAIILSFNANLRNDVYKKVSLQDKDGQIRIQLWKETWGMLKDNKFILGAGLANYQNAIIPYHQSGIFIRNDDPEFDKMVRISLEYQQQVWQPLEIYLYPHNIILNFWSELGIAGVLLFIWIIGKYFIIGIRNNELGIMQREIILGLIGAMIVIAVHGLVDAPYFKNDLAVLFWILIAMIGIYNLDKQKSSEQSH